MRRVGEIEDRYAALVPGLRHDVASWTWNQATVVRHAVFLLGLSGRHLEVAAEFELTIDDVEDRVGSPVLGIGGPAPRTRAAAPLVGEHDLPAVVVERRRMPVGKVLVHDRVESDRM